MLNQPFCESKKVADESQNISKFGVGTTYGRTGEPAEVYNSRDQLSRGFDSDVNVDVTVA